MSRMLDVYLQDKLVGCLEQTDSGDLAFAYNADIKKRHPTVFRFLCH